jgi:hypothetical protein
MERKRDATLNSAVSPRRPSPFSRSQSLQGKWLATSGATLRLSPSFDGQDGARSRRSKWDEHGCLKSKG